MISKTMISHERCNMKYDSAFAGLDKFQLHGHGHGLASIVDA
jgi:hypothetical protein